MFDAKCIECWITPYGAVGKKKQENWKGITELI